MNNEQLREEWRKEYYRPEGFVVMDEGVEINLNKIADWWLNKMEEALSHQKAELRGKIEGMGFKDPRDAGQFTLHAQGYNQAIEEVLTLLSNPQT